VVRNNLTTHIDYDKAGRKTGMTDPDMGVWSYTYDALGNLLTQTDQRTCTTTISYDLLNRPNNKAYSGTYCPATPSVTYTYDRLGVNGIGRRTGMIDGSGSTSWEYDNRGRLTKEIKTITGSGIFKTTWGYNPADMVSWIRYPSDNNSGQTEYVNYTYLPQMVLDTVYGTDTYVYNTDYDAAGRVTRRELGPSPTIQSTYTYFGWDITDGLGRLQRILTQKGTNPTLQDLQYTYDENGNVMSISDYVAIKPDLQIQSFTYDELDRLTSAEAVDYIYSDNPGGGLSLDGSYSMQNYTYDPNSGNVQSMAGASYLYTNPYMIVPPHGIQRITGGGSIYATITIRAKGTKYANVWPIMQLYVNGVYIAQWTVSSSSYTNYSAHIVNLTGNDQIEVVYTNDLSTRQLEVDYVVVNGRTLQAEGGAALIDKGNVNPDNTAFDWQNLIAGQQIMADNGALRFVVGERAFAGAYDQDGNMIARIVDGGAYILGYDAENRLVNVTGGVTATFVYDGDGNRVKGTVSGTTTAYLGNYFEWTGSTSTMKKYYYAGTTRVAMRTGSNTLNYLLGDHLGSTAITTNSSGLKNSEIRYMPWGMTRYTSGSSPTTFLFTGQRFQSEIGLYFYGTRWYDPYLNRWIQPDNIIPDSYNPLDWDRYSYTRNNPIKYRDPTGNIPCFEDGYCINGRYSSADHLRYLARLYGIIFNDNWNEDYKWAVIAGVEAVGDTLSKAIGSASSVLTFRDVFGIKGNDKFKFTWGCSECSKMAITAGAREIKFKQMYEEKAYLGRTAIDALFMNTTLVVHELFHAFENATEVTLDNGTKYKEARSTLPSHYSREGLADPFMTWQQSNDTTNGEIFADMGIGWIYNQWNTEDPGHLLAAQMSHWMENQMPNFINLAIENQR
jgi:RHS repeat-associated protein